MTRAAYAVVEASGRSGARDIQVWDPLVRLIHWSLAATILLDAAILDEDGWAHELVGYAALGLVAARLIWGIVGTRPARFTSFPPNPAAALRHLVRLRAGGQPLHLSHNPLGALMVYNLWLTVVFLGVTGMMMVNIRFFGMEWIEELHEAAFVWLMISVALHLAGVAVETLRTGVPLVRAMICGRKRVPAGTQLR